MRLSTIPELPQADSYMIEGSGSGVWPRNQVGDDEDYDKGSGSGDWGGKNKISSPLTDVFNRPSLPKYSHSSGVNHLTWSIF